jgi:hypothetical protein
MKGHNYITGGVMKKRATSKWLKVSLLFLVATLPLFLGGCGGSKSEPTFNISGNWVIYHTTSGTPGQQGPDLFSFSQSQNNLTGTTSSGTTSLSLTLSSGDVSGQNVSFGWTGSDGTTTYAYSGSVSSNGTTMSGTWHSSDGQQGTWNGIINETPIDNIAGNWNFLSTSGTPGQQGLFAFNQSINTVATITINTISGTTSQDLALTGTISSLSIIFSWTGSDGTTYIYTGTVSGSGGTAMSGTWTSINTSGQYGPSGSWSATKS